MEDSTKNASLQLSTSSTDLLALPLGSRNILDVASKRILSDAHWMQMDFSNSIGDD